MLFRVEGKEDKETQHKLASIAEGPFRLKDVHKAINTDVIEKDYLSIDIVSSPFVTLAPTLKSSSELLEDSRPQSDEKLGR